MTMHRHAHRHNQNKYKNEYEDEDNKQNSTQTQRGAWGGQRHSSRSTTVTQQNHHSVHYHSSNPRHYSRLRGHTNRSRHRRLHNSNRHPRSRSRSRSRSPPPLHNKPVSHHRTRSRSRKNYNCRWHWAQSYNSSQNTSEHNRQHVSEHTSNRSRYQYYSSASASARQQHNAYNTPQNKYIDYNAKPHQKVVNNNVPPYLLTTYSRANAGPTPDPNPRHNPHSHRMRSVGNRSPSPGAVTTPHGWNGAKTGFGFCASAEHDSNHASPMRMRNNMTPDTSASLAAWQKWQNRKLWSNVILSDKSQFTFKSTASCTVMALECALQLQLQLCGFCKSKMEDQQLVEMVLKVASLYKSEKHTDVHDILKVSRYKRNLHILGTHQFLAPKWNELTAFCLKMAKQHRCEVSAVVSKPPESIFVHFRFPFLSEQQYTPCYPLVFDSHARPERGLTGAHLLTFDTGDSFVQYLNVLWNVIDLPPNATLLEQEYNIVNVNVIGLKDIRRTPRIDFKKLEQEFSTLVVKQFHASVTVPVLANKNKNNTSSNSQKRLSNSSHNHNQQQQRRCKNRYNHSDRKRDRPIAPAPAPVPVPALVDNTKQKRRVIQLEQSLRKVQESVNVLALKFEKSEAAKNELLGQIKQLERQRATMCANYSHVTNEKQASASEEQLRAQMQTVTDLEVNVMNAENGRPAEAGDRLDRDDTDHMPDLFRKEKLEKITLTQRTMRSEMDGMRAEFDVWKESERNLFQQSYSKLQSQLRMKEEQNERMQQELDRTRRHSEDLVAINAALHDNQNRVQQRPRFGSMVQTMPHELMDDITAHNAANADDQTAVAEAPKPVSPTTFECSICMTEFNRIEDGFQIQACGHWLDRKCAYMAFKADIVNVHTLPRCPQCLADDEQITLVNDSELQLLLPDNAMHLYFKLCVNLATQTMSNIFRCPTANCPFFAQIPVTLLRFNCVSCGFSTCTQCKRSVHEPETCAEYKQRKQHEQDLSEQQLAELAEANGWKQCPDCRVYIERTFGCRHMQCKNPSCAAHFCDVCGQKLDRDNWKPHFNAPNECRLWLNYDDLLDNDNNNNNSNSNRNNADADLMTTTTMR